METLAKSFRLRLLTQGPGARRAGPSRIGAPDDLDREGMKRHIPTKHNWKKEFIKQLTKGDKSEAYGTHLYTRMELNRH